ncbi:MAG: sulfatase-like hydrolase/transferase, partial [Actinomycetota bacterium]|nr:sulfatase-like hydrolase/transferase [Actinomycetota bacterium]
GQEWEAYRRMLQDHEAGRFLKRRGYRYVHLGSRWSATARGEMADVNLRYETWSEFSTVLYQSTLLPRIVHSMGVAEGALDPRKEAWEITRFQLDMLERARDMPGPKLVFAHMLVPHWPHVFDPDGGYVTEEQERRRGYRRVYGDQVAYLNDRLATLVDHLLAGPEEEHPIIVIQADEGPYPGTRDGFQLPTDAMTPEQLRDKYSIISAVYLPGASADALPSTLSHVNLFRAIFGHEFDADLRLLPERSYGTDRRRTRFIDITRILDRAPPAGGAADAAAPA